MIKQKVSRDVCIYCHDKQLSCPVHWLTERRNKQMPTFSPNYEVLTCEKCHKVIGQIFTDAKILQKVTCKECLD